jgi:hypothetical protein
LEISTPRWNLARSKQLVLRLQVAALQRQIVLIPATLMAQGTALSTDAMDGNSARRDRN